MSFARPVKPICSALRLIWPVSSTSVFAKLGIFACFGETLSPLHLLQIACARRNRHRSIEGPGMMYNFRSVWPMRVTYPRVTAAHKILAVIIFSTLLIPAVIVWAVSSSHRSTPVK